MDKKTIIAVDLDDTLLTTKKEVSLKTLDVLKRCKNKGYILVVSSTRGYSTCGEIAQLIDADYVCCQAGNMIVDKKKKIIYKNPFKQEDVIDVIDYFSLFTESIFIDSDFYLCGCVKNDFSNKWNITMCKESKFRLLSAYKLCIGFKDEESKQRIIDYCSKKGFVCRKVIDDDIMFVTPLNSDKYYALEQLTKMLKTDNEHLVVFGDDHSDLLSIQKAGVGVAMKNSKPEILKIAKYITLTNDEEGVAVFLEEKYLK